jgi:transposase
MAVEITRTGLDLAGLRRAAAQSRDSDAARRMLALALVLDGRSRTEAATLCGMDRQIPSDWVHRYNEFGLAGLSNLVSPGPPSRPTPEQEAEVARLVQEGPDLAAHGVIRWRRIDLSRVIAARFGVHLAERSVGDLPRRLGFRRLSARPRHTGHDAAGQAAHKTYLITHVDP